MYSKKTKILYGEKSFQIQCLFRTPFLSCFTLLGCSDISLLINWNYLQPSMRRHSALLEQQQKQKSQEARANCGSLKNSKFDYTEAAVSTSSVSTPTNEVGESPFSRDSLGDTVIHLDKVRQDPVCGSRYKGIGLYWSLYPFKMAQDSRLHAGVWCFVMPYDT